MPYNGTTYFYATNLQGDVVAILDSSGKAVVKYSYDAWGKLLSTTGSLASTLGVHNPLRYRGYVYDPETGLYYVSSRYYYPELSRFINTDDVSLLGANGDFSSLNLFAYCGNNPATREDAHGTFWHVVAGALIGGMVSGFSKAIELMNSKESPKEKAIQIATAAVFGMVGGGLAATGIGQVGQIIIGGVLGAAEYATAQALQGEEISTNELITSGVCGLVGGAYGGEGAAYGSKFMKYHRGKFVENMNLRGVGDAVKTMWRQTAKWTSQHLIRPTAIGVAKAYIGNKGAYYTIAGTTKAVNGLCSLN